MSRNLLLLFDRPCEPVFVPKGEQKLCFDLPAAYLSDDYRPNAQEIFDRYYKEANKIRIPLKKIAIPDLKEALKVGRYEAFSLFVVRHQKATDHLIKLFLGMRNSEELLSLAVFCRDRLNPEMFLYALSVAILHRPDTKDLAIPPLCEIFPSKYMDSGVFNRAKESANVSTVKKRKPVEIPFEWTGSKDSNPEQKVAYFREDIGVNLHHWHWHLIYPALGGREIVAKDRRGELFYYMHHQIIARYNVERMCNGLSRVKPLNNFRDVIPEGYFPKLDDSVSGRAWPGRPSNVTLFDVKRKADDTQFTIRDLEIWRQRILEAIENRSALSKTGSLVALDEKTGIDILGNMIEACTELSINYDYYGSLHNWGHDCIAFVHDPEHSHLEAFGVMGSNTTAMRDPVFYRWHAFVDWLFYQFLDRLPPYTAQELTFPGVTVQDIFIQGPNAGPNVLNCRWTKSDINLSRGLDFTPRGAVFARVQHLDHDFFCYTFTVQNNNNREVVGTVRVFIAPKKDETGRLFTQDEQRMLMIEMDKFTTRLVRGRNVIERNSIDSSITIPFEATFRNVDQGRPDDTDLQNRNAFNFCGCGWPQHMLVPKGNEEPEGYPMDLFVMVSDYQLDKVDQDGPEGCRTGVSFCGLRDRKYPDKRAMGFPFDRKARSGVSAMNNFLTPNMKLQEITVKFTNAIGSLQSNKKCNPDWE